MFEDLIPNKQATAPTSLTAPATTGAVSGGSNMFADLVPEKKKPSFLGQIAGGVIRSADNLANTAMSNIEALADKLAKKTPTGSFQIPFTDTTVYINPNAQGRKSLNQSFDEIGSGVDANKAFSEPATTEQLRDKNYSELQQEASKKIAKTQLSTLLSGQEARGADLSTAKGWRQTAGDSIMTASNFIPAGKLAQGGSFLKSTLAVAKEGAKTGALYGIGDELASNKKDVTAGGVAENALVSGGMGALFAGGLQTAGRGVTKLVGGASDILTKSSDDIAKNALVSGLAKTGDRLKTVQSKIDKNTFSVAGVDGKKMTISPIDTFKEYNFIPEVTAKGDILTNKIQEQIAKHIDDSDDAITNVLKDTGKSMSIKQFKDKVAKAIMSDETLMDQGRVRMTLNKLDNYIDDISASYGNDLSFARLNNIRKVANKDFKDETIDLSRKIGDVARDTVYNSTDDKVVKQMLLEQRKLITADKLAKQLNNMKAEGGRLGNMMSTGIGAILGEDSKLPLGGFLGAGALRALQYGKQQATFRTPATTIKKGLESILGKNATLSKATIDKFTPKIAKTIYNKADDYLKSPNNIDTNINATKAPIDDIISRVDNSNYNPKQLLALPAGDKSSGFVSKVSSGKTIELPTSITDTYLGKEGMKNTKITRVSNESGGLGKVIGKPLKVDVKGGVEKIFGQKSPNNQPANSTPNMTGNTSIDNIISQELDPLEKYAIKNGNNIYYHATPVKNVDSIMNNGFKGSTFVWDSKEKALDYIKSLDDGDSWAIVSGATKESPDFGKTDPFNGDGWKVNKITPLKKYIINN